MGQDKYACFTFRLNMDEPSQVRLNDILKNLNPEYYKSKNQFLIEAILFYIDNYGKDSFVKPQENETVRYLTKEDFEGLKDDIAESAKAAAREEIIRTLGLFMSGANTQSMIRNVPEATPVEEEPAAIEDDEVVTGLALKWMNGIEGDT